MKVDYYLLINIIIIIRRRERDRTVSRSLYIIDD